jgi:hypothetical protein
MNVGREAIIEKRIKVIYCHMSRMISNGLTKALEGNVFLTFADLILGIGIKQPEGVGFWEPLALYFVLSCFTSRKSCM